MLDDVSDWLALGLHGSVVGLHVVEFSHASAFNITVAIGVAYMSLSSLEAYHLRKKLRMHNHFKPTNGGQNETDE